MCVHACVRAHVCVYAINIGIFKGAPFKQYIYKLEYVLNKIVSPIIWGLNTVKSAIYDAGVLTLRSRDCYVTTESR